MCYRGGRLRLNEVGDFVIRVRCDNEYVCCDVRLYFDYP